MFILLIFIISWFSMAGAFLISEASTGHCHWSSSVSTSCDSEDDSSSSSCAKSALALAVAFTIAFLSLSLRSQHSAMSCERQLWLLLARHSLQNLLFLFYGSFDNCQLTLGKFNATVHLPYFQTKNSLISSLISPSFTCYKEKNPGYFCDKRTVLYLLIQV